MSMLPTRARGLNSDGVTQGQMALWAEFHRLGIRSPADVLDALTKVVFWVRSAQPTRILEAREAAVAGRTEGERLTEFREGGFREAL